MRVFDTIHLQALEGCGLQLGILPISTIAVMAADLASFMDQEVFSGTVAGGDLMARRVSSLSARYRFS